jgi:hypothetical protein
MFNAAGSRYGGAGRPIDDDCRKVRKNDGVSVWYVLGKPEINSLQEPRGSLKNELALLGFILSISAILGSMQFARLKLRKRNI